MNKSSESPLHSLQQKSSNCQAIMVLLQLRVRGITGFVTSVEIESSSTVAHLRDQIRSVIGEHTFFPDNCILLYSQTGVGTVRLREETRGLDAYNVNEAGVIDLTLEFTANSEFFSDPDDDLVSMVKFQDDAHMVNFPLVDEIRSRLSAYRRSGLRLFLTDMSLPTQQHNPTAPGVAAPAEAPGRRMTSALHEAIRVFSSEHFRTVREVFVKPSEILRELLFSGTCWPMLDTRDSEGSLPLEIAERASRDATHDPATQDLAQSDSGPLKLVLSAFHARATLGFLRRVALLVREQRSDGVFPEVGGGILGLFLKLDPSVRVENASSTWQDAVHSHLPVVPDEDSSPIASWAIGPNPGRDQLRLNGLSPNRRIVPLQERVLSFLWHSAEQPLEPEIDP
uniref:Ubiquitin-like domain-containing protein n=1 Tax=Chromera velia CCMP2878 TaxID=1169474 RepID=A0A0G4G1F7_9ALVE|eukprot:Cvel_4028.t1-p1 / transcript=Cvel_4028.t1 / gene=Cvel_4028 / organism=Chromera_velia_CCMP2878 / gene_product=hypothetical protein / transcript_product=hypothetical protein / location=Cvel_scaffold171:69821-71005(-) / protein_length=395 / sequence_SO=supercontig / SO=protein_coding / is_pseudo=false